MKLLLAIMIVSAVAKAQQGGVLIGPEGGQPENCAALEVRSQANSAPKGFLPPRMLWSQMLLVPTPVQGLIVYVTDTDHPGYYFYNGTAWLPLGDGAGLWDQTTNGPGVCRLTGAVGIGTTTPVELVQFGDRFVFHNGGTKVLAYNLRYNGTTLSDVKLFPNSGTCQIRFEDAGGLRILTAPAAAAGSNSTVIDVKGKFIMSPQGNIGIGMEPDNQYKFMLGGGIAAFRGTGTLKSVEIGKDGNEIAARDNANGTFTALYINNGNENEGIGDRRVILGNEDLPNTNYDNLWVCGKSRFLGHATFEDGYTSNSDSTLKTNIVPLSNSLSKIVLLNGVSYRYKKSSDGRVHLGVIAQNVQQVVPELVRTNIIQNKEGGEHAVLSVDYDGLIPLLIEAMKEQQQQIEALKAKVAALENK